MDKKDFIRKNTYFNETFLITECLSVSAEPRCDHEKFSHHDEFELYWIFEGDLSFSYEGEMIDITPGDIVIIAPHIIHRAVLKNNCFYHRKHIKFSVDFFLDKYELYDRLVERRIIRLNKKEISELGLDKLLIEMEGDLSLKTSYGDFCALTNLLYFLKTAERYCDSFKIQLTPRKSEMVAEIIKYIDENLCSDLDYKTVAANFCTSEKNIYKVFKKKTGFSLKKYVTERRIIRAKYILNRGGTANDAFLATGYKDYSVFYRNFFKITGMAPTSFASKSNTVKREV